MSQRTIPQIRARLFELALEHSLPELAELALETRRRPCVRRAPAYSAPLTASLAREVRRYAAINPDMPYAEIAIRFRINQGRVSEALAGTRG